MNERVLFKKGKQRKFLNEVLVRLHCVSQRSLLQMGFNISYASLKNYFSERRLLPRDFFEELLYLTKIPKDSMNVQFINKNWGQVKGGTIGKRLKMNKKYNQ